MPFSITLSEILYEEYGFWWMGFQACSLYIYTDYVMVGVSMHSHVLITINRIWALVFPVSYKHHHNFKTAWLVCLAMVVYVHVFCLPGFLMDLMYYRVDSDESCGLDIDLLQEWSILVQIVIYDFPIIFIVASYPFLLRKQLRRGKTVSAMTGTLDRSGSVKFRKRKEQTKPFVLLTLLTVGILICWTPTMIFYTMASFMSVG
ncbi:uncharacterized protein LOC129600375 [Paramacrobiotus metropolitanus]|uniref:uncharacterized protein LOC129600375 n=1 Tax=Paramacrobiotus metropolitanus TaxID=2943436 RepID=UPI002445B5CD|nr:uncharacterized protein LOC129600375 [Paramacrobiotus metropolitanus]